MNARTDRNQAEIVKALRQIGCSVTVTSAVKHGFPDLAVGYHSRTYLLEIKDGKLPPSRRRLTPDEQRWHKEWRGQVDVVTDVADAMKAIGAL